VIKIHEEAVLSTKTFGSDIAVHASFEGIAFYKLLYKNERVHFSSIITHPLACHDPNPTQRMPIT